MENKVQEPVVEPKVSDTTIDPVAELKAESAKEIAGLNRRISQMDKALKDAELAKLNETERAKAEIELAKTERDNILKETEQLKRARMIDVAIVDAGLPLDFANRIKGTTEDEIKEDVKVLKEWLDKTVNQKIAETTNQILSGKAPTQSAPPAGSITRASFEALSQVDKNKVLAAKTKIV